MDIELVSVVINLVTALAAVAGVITAAFLGMKAVAVAAETVQRASLDYAAGRADLITQARVGVFESMAELKASLHVFWKEDPEVLFARDPESARAKQLIAKREDAEATAHQAMYRLQGAAERLREVLPTAQILESKSRGKGNRKTRDVRAPVGIDMPSITQLVNLYERGAMALYLSLVPSESFPDPKTEPERFSKQFINQLELDSSEAFESVWPARVREWLENELSVISNQSTPEIIAINFVEAFLDKELAKAVHTVTEPVLAESRAEVLVGAKK